MPFPRTCEHSRCLGPHRSPAPRVSEGSNCRTTYFTFYCVFCDVVTSMRDSFWAHLASCLNASQVPGLTPTCSRGCPLTEPLSSQGPLSHDRYIAENTAMLFASHALRHVAGFVLNHGRKGLRERVMCPICCPFGLPPSVLASAVGLEKHSTGIPEHAPPRENSASSSVTL